MRITIIFFWNSSHSSSTSKLISTLLIKIVSSEGLTFLTVGLSKIIYWTRRSMTCHFLWTNFAYSDFGYSIFVFSLYHYFADFVYLFRDRLPPNVQPFNKHYMFYLCIYTEKFCALLLPPSRQLLREMMKLWLPPLKGAAAAPVSGSYSADARQSLCTFTLKHIKVGRCAATARHRRSYCPELAPLLRLFWKLLLLYLKSRSCAQKFSVYIYLSRDPFFHSRSKVFCFYCLPLTLICCCSCPSLSHQPRSWVFPESHSYWSPTFLLHLCWPNLRPSPIQPPCRSLNIFRLTAFSKVPQTSRPKRSGPAFCLFIFHQIGCTWTPFLKFLHIPWYLCFPFGNIAWTCYAQASHLMQPFVPERPVVAFGIIVDRFQKFHHLRFFAFFFFEK